MDETARRERFEAVVMRHLDAAYNLAWWLLRDEHEAADAVQDACAKAWRLIDGYRGGDAKAWLLAVVRTAAADRRRRQLRIRRTEEDARRADPAEKADAGPLAGLIRSADRTVVSEALASLPEAHREVLVLRDIEGLSYAEIGTVIGVPLGTVMSRVSRARDAMTAALKVAMKGSDL